MTDQAARPDASQAEQPPARHSGADALTIAGGAHGERRDASANRRRILATARDLFTTRGVEPVSMHDVALAAGIGQGTLYRRYAHKAALCHALLEENMQLFHGEVAARLDWEASTRAALDQLCCFLDDVLGFIEANGPLVHAMGDSACGVSREERDRLPWMVWQRDTITLLLARAIDQGEIEPVDVEATVDVVMAACDPAQYLHQRLHRGFDRGRVVASLRRLLTGLAGARSPERAR